MLNGLKLWMNVGGRVLGAFLSLHAHALISRATSARSDARECAAVI
jgi:hypothetical protein